MYYGISTKSKNQISNYVSKHLAKQKMSHQTTKVNNTLITEKDPTKSIVNTFRKGISKEKSSTKYKTSKNSRMINNI